MPQDEKLQKLAEFVKSIQGDAVSYAQIKEFMIMLIGLLRQKSLFNEEERRKFDTFFTLKSETLDAENRKQWLKIQEYVKTLKDGKTPIAGVDYPTRNELINIIEDYIDALPKPEPIPLPKEFTFEDLLDFLTRLPEGSIDAKAIANLPKPISQETNVPFIDRGMPHVGAFETPIIAGSNITVQKDAFGRWVISASVTGGSGFTELTATGTVDSNNRTFSFSQKPTYVVSDGVWYKENKGWTYAAPNVTMDIPPNDNIWGFV